MRDPFSLLPLRPWRPGRTDLARFARVFQLGNSAGHPLALPDDFSYYSQLGG